MSGPYSYSSKEQLVEIDIGGGFFGLTRIDNEDLPVQLGEVELVVTPHYFRYRIATGDNQFLEQRRRHSSFERHFGALTANAIVADVLFQHKSSALMLAFSSSFCNRLCVWVKGLPGSHRSDDVWLMPSLRACRFKVAFLEQHVAPMGSIPRLPYLSL